MRIIVSTAVILSLVETFMVREHVQAFIACGHPSYALIFVLSCLAAKVLMDRRGEQ
jgi:hypothetical protein